jgi:hypothetical protein
VDVCIDLPIHNISGLVLAPASFLPLDYWSVCVVDVVVVHVWVRGIERRIKIEKRYLGFFFRDGSGFFLGFFTEGLGFFTEGLRGRFLTAFLSWSVQSVSSRSARFSNVLTTTESTDEREELAGTLFETGEFDALEGENSLGGDENSDKSEGEN